MLQTISQWFLLCQGEAYLCFIGRVRKGEYSTFGVWGGPRYDAPHQAAVEQNFLGEAVVPAEMLQVFPPLGSLGRCAHGWNFSSITKHQSSTSTTKRICTMCDFEAPKVVFFFHWEKKKVWKPLEVLCSHREQKLILAASCLQLRTLVMKFKTFQSALFLCGLSFSSSCSYIRTSEAVQPSISIWLGLSRPNCHPNNRNFEMPLNKTQNSSLNYLGALLHEQFKDIYNIAPPSWYKDAGEILNITNVHIPIRKKPSS